MKKELFSTAEVAKILGISRIAVFKKIKSGEIKAKKVGRAFVIRKEDVPGVLVKQLTQEQKRGIEAVVEKTIKEYGLTLKLLGQE